MKPVTKQIPNMMPSHTPSWLVSLGVRSLEVNCFMGARLCSRHRRSTEESGE
jgi:hypothetical protein